MTYRQRHDDWTQETLGVRTMSKMQTRIAQLKIKGNSIPYWREWLRTLEHPMLQEGTCQKYEGTIEPTNMRTP